MVDLSPVTDGVARLAWAESDLARVEEVRRVVASAFADGVHRMETHVPVDDAVGQRLATWGGLRREGVARGVAGGEDRVVYARLADDTPVEEPEGFRALLNSFLPRKRAIAQLLVRSTDGRVLLCGLTYKPDRDLPGGVVEVGESPQVAVGREVTEELGLTLEVGRLLLTDWLPAWSGWDDALCLVFDGGEHDPSLLDAVVRDGREIATVAFHPVSEIDEVCADFTARRVHSALANLAGGPAYVESGG